jgi:flavin-dependent dehydrogenase
MNTQVYNYDVAVIGGGMAGVAAAYALKDSGKKILLVEGRERLGGTAVLSYVFDWIAGIFPRVFGGGIYLSQTGGQGKRRS